MQLWKNGPYWAETNIGADNPEDSGLYFWWGDTLGYKRENDAWAASDGSVTDYGFYSTNTPTYDVKVATLQSEGWITEEGVLAPEHDAAQSHWGGTWRMPTDADFSALVNNCDWTWTTRNGVDGYEVRGKGDYAEAAIFLPDAGYGYGASLYFSVWYGYYWSSSPHSSSSGSAWYFYFDADKVRRYYYYYYRSRGQSVRALRGVAE